MNATSIVAAVNQLHVDKRMYFHTRDNARAIVAALRPYAGKTGIHIKAPVKNENGWAFGFAHDGGTLHFPKEINQ